MKTREKKRKASKKIILFIILGMMINTGYSQISLAENESLGINYSYESSRMIKNRMFIQANYTVGRKSFEFGFSTNSIKMNTQGFLFKHKVFLNRNNNEYEDFNVESYKIRPYAIYKFVMFSSPAGSLRDRTIRLEPGNPFQNSITSSTINTIEHYLGLGTEFKLYNKIFIECMAAGGLNFLKNNSEAVIINDRLLPKASVELTWDLSLGVNYRF